MKQPAPRKPAASRRRPPKTAAPRKKRADKPYEPDFDPVPRRFERHDGWTPDKQAGFLRALAETACVTEACQAVGMDSSSAYKLRAQFSAVSFRNAWDAALDYGVRRLADAALSRSLKGVAVPIFFQGEQIGERRYYDERLTMFLLRYRDPVRYGAYNDRAEHRGHPEGAAMAFTRLLVRAEEDAALTMREVAERTGRRIREITREAFGPDVLPPEERFEEEKEGGT